MSLRAVSGSLLSTSGSARVLKAPGSAFEKLGADRLVGRAVDRRIAPLATLAARQEGRATRGTTEPGPAPPLFSPSASQNPRLAIQGSAPRSATMRPGGLTRSRSALDSALRWTVLMFCLVWPQSAPAVEKMSSAAAAEEEKAPFRSEFAIRAFGMNVVDAAVERLSSPSKPGTSEIVASAKTTALGSLIYSIDNRYHSWVDSEGVAAWHHRIRQKNVHHEIGAKRDPGSGRLSDEAPLRASSPLGGTTFGAMIVGFTERSWSSEDSTSHVLDLQGRHMRADVRFTGRASMRILGDEQSGVWLEVSWSELSTSPGWWLEKTDMLTYHLVEDDCRWRFFVTDGREIGRVSVTCSGFDVIADLVRHTANGVVRVHSDRGRVSKRRRRTRERTWN